MINVQFPGNAFILYDNMIIVATFDFLPTDDWYPYIFPNVPEGVPFTSKFDRLGYGHNVLLFNMGTLLIFFFYHIFCYLVAWPIYFLHTETKWAKKLYHGWIIPTCFWNGTILFVQEAYIELLLSATVNVLQLLNDWSKWDIIFTNVLSILVLIGCIMLPVYIIVFIWPNYKPYKEIKVGKDRLIANKLTEPEWYERYSAIYDMIDLKRHKPGVMLHCVLFLFRRFVFVAIVIFLVEYPVF